MDLHLLLQHSSERGLLLHIITQLDTIMKTQADSIAAATKLSTASDALSVKVDKLVADVDKAIDALKNVSLPPEGEAAVAALEASSAGVATAGDHVDAEVTALDAVLPTPAPAAPVTPA